MIINYEHEPNVISFMGRAIRRANASYGARLLEEDRVATRKAEVLKLMDHHRREATRHGRLLDTLREELKLLERNNAV